MSSTSRLLIVCLATAVLAAGCRHDPEKAKQQYLERGNAYFGQAKYSEATIEYRKAINEDARFAEAHYRLGLAYEQLRDRANALRELGHAAATAPDRKDIQIKAGQHYLLAAKFDEARKAAEKVLDKDVRNIDAQLLLANALAGMNQIDAAATQIEEAIKTDPANVSSYSNLAAYEIARGNLPKAEEVFRNAITIAPQSVEARLGLASLYWATNKKKE